MQLWAKCHFNHLFRLLLPVHFPLSLDATLSCIKWIVELHLSMRLDTGHLYSLVSRVRRMLLMPGSINIIWHLEPPLSTHSNDWPYGRFVRCKICWFWKNSHSARHRNNTQWAVLLKSIFISDVFRRSVVCLPVSWRLYTNPHGMFKIEIPFYLGINLDSSQVNKWHGQMEAAGSSKVGHILISICFSIHMHPWI